MTDKDKRPWVLRPRHAHRKASDPEGATRNWSQEEHAQFLMATSHTKAQRRQAIRALRDAHFARRRQGEREKYGGKPLTQAEIRVLWLKKRHQIARLKRRFGDFDFQ